MLVRWSGRHKVVVQLRGSKMWSLHGSQYIGHSVMIGTGNFLSTSDKQIALLFSFLRFYEIILYVYE